MSSVEEYFWRLGDWSLAFLLETWRKPTWHASAAALEVPYKLDSILRFEVPKPRMLYVKNWDPDHFEQAEYLLAEMMGPLLRAGDRQQRAMAKRGDVALHWYLRCDRPVRRDRFEQ